MKKILFGVVVLISTTTFSHSQPQEGVKKNKGIGLSFPICHFFDNTPTNWGILVPYYGEKILPLNFEINYYWNRKESINQFQTSVLFYIMSYPYLGRNNKPGDILDRGYVVFSGGYLYNLMGSINSRVDALLEANFRYGYETYHVSYPRWFEQRVHSHTLADAGLTLGIQGTTKLFWRMNAIAGVKYTRYVFRLNNGNPPVFPGDKGTSKNTLTLKLGLAYEFR